MAKAKDKYWQYRVVLAIAKADNDLTYEDIGKSLGISERTIRRYFVDPGRMNLRTMARLHKAIGLDAATAQSVLPIT